MAEAKSRRARSEAIVVPSVRAYRLWSPAELRNAEISADSGYLRPCVDLCDWILADGKVRGSLDIRIDGWTQLPLTFDGSGDRRRRARAVKALEVGEDWDAMFPEPTVKQVASWALILGFAPFVLRWHPLEEHEGRDIPVTDFYHPQGIAYDWQARTWTRETERGAKEPIVFGDGVWECHMPYGTFRPWNLGLWRALAPWVLLKRYAMSDFGQAGEAGQQVVIESDRSEFDSEADADGGNSTEKLRKQLAKDLKEKARNGKIVLPPGFRYKAVELSASTKDLYDKQITLADTAIAITINGGNLATEVRERGSKGAGEVQERSGTLPHRRADAGAWETTSRRVLVWWSLSNYGDRKLAPWPEYATEPEEDKKLAAETGKMGLEVIHLAEAHGWVVDREVGADKFGMGDFLKPGTPTAPPTPPAPGQPAADPNDPKAKDDKKPPPKAKALLAAAGGARRGFLAGQLYTDAVAEETAELAAAALEPTLEALREEIAAATDYEDLRERLRARYADEMDAEELSELVAAAMVLASFAGRAAVNQDAT
jgi:hypothetical protein